MYTDVVIVGLGKTGLSCARYFEKQGIPFSMIDTRDPLAQAIVSKAKTIVLSPGVPSDHPIIHSAMQSNHPPDIIGDIELFARAYPGPFIAITGSNGKSTVTTLVGEMAKAAGFDVGVGGNLGTPVLDLLAQNHELYVLELSSFQLETTYNLKSSVATILNLSPDHLDRYTAMKDYVNAKARIFLNAQKVVLNRDDPLVMQIAGSVVIPAPTLTFGLDKPSDQHYGVIEEEGVAWIARGAEKLIAISELKLLGNHNVANALAALALAESVNLPMFSSVQALKAFKGLAHRCEWVRTYQGIPFINDSKGTNVGATLASLQGLSGSILGKWVLIAGGVAKNADFSPMKEILKRSCRALILM
ncbi:MAG: UDP-N-acetylmuramoyl-L-alanine--D-glutamate ligase, partial [Gammaproteobacteria bacterium]|nr:UDP-N-acetylmuramoyl-L-alanine--D-glutamate ligase [Gammaproteobacteria bacterium]